jgi:hypothetical protein
MWRKEMSAIFSKSVYCSTLAKVALLGLMAFCGAANPAFGQETVSGKFTLTENARLGNRSLPAGTYKFSVEATGVMQSVNTIQGAPQVVQVIVTPEAKSGPVTLIFAMATRSKQAMYSSKLVLSPEKNEMVMHSMSLDQQGLVLDFDSLSGKGKTQVVAQAPRSEAVAVSRAAD